MTEKEAFEIIKPHLENDTVKSVSFVIRWKGYDVYSPNFQEDLGCTGYPNFILVDSKHQVRGTSVDEYIDIIREYKNSIKDS